MLYINSWESVFGRRMKIHLIMINFMAMKKTIKIFNLHHSKENSSHTHTQTHTEAVRMPQIDNDSSALLYNLIN